MRISMEDVGKYITYLTASSYFCAIYIHSVNNANIRNTVAIVCSGVSCHSGLPYLIPPPALLSLSVPTLARALSFPLFLLL